MVGSVKKLLTNITRGDVLNVKTMETIVVEVEATINRRPLTAVNADSRDLEALTPAHILYPSTFAHSSATIIPDNPLTDADTLRSNWRRAQARVNAFWTAWSRLYLTSLHERKKWTKVEKNLKLNDLVLIVEPAVARNEWRLARVVDVESDDGLVRKATVKRADGKLLLRDRNKIVALELDE